MSFVKADPAPLEAAGLRWLAQGGARVPEILQEAPGRLVLQRIEPGRLDAAGEEDLGRMLARMHAAGAERFGSLPGRGAFRVGRLELPSAEGDHWPVFYASQRLAPAARAAGLEREVEPVCERIESLCGPPEPPARLHGDLWSGNVLADRDGRPWLIDPAAYGGHREIDFAMLDLFGSVPARTRAAYEEVAPLADGWPDRVPLHQLFPLLVHAALFGGSYVASARATARALAR